jgi:uncharacterized protein DUF559
MRALDEQAHRLAEDQHGVFAHWQLRSRDRHAVAHRLDSGTWEHLFEGVYRVPGSPRTWRQRLMAAVLAGGPHAVASHRSAAALLGIPGFPEGIVEMTAPRRRRHRRPLVHQSRQLPAEHLTVIDGIPVTRVARTLVDLAGTIHPRQTERAVDNCLSMRIVTVASLVGVTLDLAKRGRTGIGLMRELLDARGDAYIAPASELEARFFELVGAYGLPEPIRQFNAGDDERWLGRIDVTYPRIRLLIELDSRRHHSSKLDREADAERDRQLLAAGWNEVLRLTWDDVTARPGWVVAQLRKRLATAA